MRCARMSAARGSTRTPNLHRRQLGSRPRGVIPVVVGCRLFQTAVARTPFASRITKNRYAPATPPVACTNSRVGVPLTDGKAIPDNQSAPEEDRPPGNSSLSPDLTWYALKWTQPTTSDAIHAQYAHH